MLGEHLQSGLAKLVIGNYLQLGRNNRLNPEGQPHLARLIADFNTQSQIRFSDYIDMLSGFDTESNISGLENLKKVKDQPVLIASNHLNEGPLRGQGQRLIISHCVRQITQKEIRWLHGQDKTSPQELIRKRFMEKANNIPVRNDNPTNASQSIKIALRNKDTIGLNPEGNGSKKGLREGLAEAGRFIALSASCGYAIVCISTSFQNGAFSLTISNPIGKDEILQAAKSLHALDKPTKYHVISNYVMAIIAQNLPEEKRGFYSNPLQFISSFKGLNE